MTPPIDVSVIVINYNSVQFTRECLHSVYAGAAASALEVIVVDNASGDGCGEMIATEFPDVHFIQSVRNIGFAGANNLGITLASGKHILFLNPDTEIKDSAIDRLLAALATVPDAGMVGAHLLNSDLSTQTTSISSFPSIVNQTLGTEYLRQRFPQAKLWGMKALFEDHRNPVLVEAVSGACIMAKREVIERVQGFATDYFMYGEDLDLCWRVRKAGWGIYYVPDAVIVHYGGQSTTSRGERDYAALMIKESMAKFMRLHKGRPYAAAFKLTTCLAAALRLLLLVCQLPVVLWNSRRQVVLRAMGKWARIMGWSLGRQTWVKRERTAPESSPLLAPGSDSL